MSDLLNILESPVAQVGIGILVKSNPEIGLALDLFKMLAQGWQMKHDIDVASQAIDSMAAEHMRRLLSKDITPFERSEVEIRLHELLTVLIKLGSL